MNSIDTILTRRSIRRYKSVTVEEEKIKEILKCAQYAPSAVNKQPWHFIVIDDKELFNRIMEIHPHSRMLATASHAVVVCGDEQLQHDDGYWIADCGAATQNILLAAHSLRIGSCWVGLYPRQQRMSDISELLELPKHIKPFALISLGYPDEEKKHPDRFSVKKIFRNKWNHAW
ncbi:MAG: nitroreductase family protein [Bacteroidales bacterium]